LEALRSAGLVPGPVGADEEAEQFAPLRAVS
jgi:hypothetical protein